MDPTLIFHFPVLIWDYLLEKVFLDKIRLPFQAVESINRINGRIPPVAARNKFSHNEFGISLTGFFFDLFLFVYLEDR